MRDAGMRDKYCVRSPAYAAPPRQGTTDPEWTLAPVLDTAGHVQGFLLAVDAVMEGHERSHKVEQQHVDRLGSPDITDLKAIQRERERLLAQVETYAAELSHANAQLATRTADLQEANRRLEERAEDLRMAGAQLESLASELRQQRNSLADTTYHLEAERALFDAVLQQMPAG
jgi:hypothetical protein